MRNHWSSLTSAALVILLAAVPHVRAAETGAPALPDLAQKAEGRPAPTGHPEGWQTWTWDGNCFAIHYAKGPSLTGVQNGDTYIAVKHLPRERNYDNVSVVSGFGDITGTQGTLEVGGQEFALLVYGNAGFVRSGDPEHRLMDLLAKSKEATVTWYKKDGMAVQSYDVSDFTAAKRTIDVACPHVAPPSPVASADDKPAEKPTEPAAASRKKKHR